MRCAGPQHPRIMPETESHLLSADNNTRSIGGMVVLSADNSVLARCRKKGRVKAQGLVSTSRFVLISKGLRNE